VASVSITDDSIVLFGGGRMGAAMLRGWIGGGMTPSRVTVIDPTPPAELAAYAATTGIALNGSIRQAPAQVIVLAVKPQKAGELRAALGAIVAPDTLVLSIMAGKTLADLARLAPGTEAIVRAVPNLPAAVGRGATVAVASGACSAAQRDRAARLLASAGTFDWIDDETLMDVVTGLSGSGPAYLFYLADCLTEAGIAAGLPVTIAERLARATVAGAGEMLRLSDKSAAELRRDVTSPAGTTEVGLRVLMAGGTLQALMTGTVAAATQRASELAG
jgi:pyrroline-5-carboxylate reductase